MWCVPRIDEEFVNKMADVLEVYGRPLDPKEPVVAIDERPTPLRADAREPLPAKPGRHRRVDYEYVRKGTANIFCIIAPKSGRHFSYVTENRKGPAFADALKRIAARYPRARKIHLVMDNLNTHSTKSLIDAFGKRGSQLAARFEFHFTPKHASWLNVAELEASAISRECLGKIRVGSLEALAERVSLWRERADAKRRPIHWSFTMDDARTIFGVERVNKLLTQH